MFFLVLADFIPKYPLESALFVETKAEATATLQIPSLLRDPQYCHLLLGEAWHKVLEEFIQSG
ncbi:MAG: hypothetical protein GY777_28815 [Candidatus Brocadiaceae bacterium]|nr:hypothetical protein [Candidatus Brocadiaceae bacterium]